MRTKVGLSHTVNATEAALHKAGIVAESALNVFVVGSALAGAGGHPNKRRLRLGDVHELI